MRRGLIILVALAVCMAAGAQTSAPLPWREWLSRWSAVQAQYQAAEDQKRREEARLEVIAVRAEIGRTMAAFEAAWAKYGASDEVMDPLDAALGALNKAGKLETLAERDQADELWDQLWSLRFALWEQGFRPPEERARP